MTHGTVANGGIARCLRTVLAAGLLLGISSTTAFSNENCQKLEALARQYAGVELTAEQKKLKAQMVAWYNQNCRAARRAAADR
jgi:hypothetical protein